MATKKMSYRKKLHKATKIEQKKPLSVTHSDFSFTKQTDVSSNTVFTGSTTPAPNK
jgi:hypothetical protein